MILICGLLLQGTCKIRAQAADAGIYQLIWEGVSLGEAAYAKTRASGVFQRMCQEIARDDMAAASKAAVLNEPKVYSFLQGPWSWENGVTWSGEWCEFTANRQVFGEFGCGLCCMANIYSTLSPYECSPMDMFDYAAEVTDYYPTTDSGAIGWGYMKQALLSSGITCDVAQKPESYETFQEHMKKMKMAVALICSYNDDTYWQDNPGHYVNIWFYNEEDDTVFLTDPGNPYNNRSRIPLRYVYDALKTSSNYQYLSVTGYVEANNTWKWNNIDDNWVAP